MSMIEIFHTQKHRTAQDQGEAQPLPGPGSYDSMLMLVMALLVIVSR